MISIIVCDDDEIFVKDLSKKLQRELEGLDINYDLETFTSSRKLLQEYKKREERPDLLILDIDMPELDGIALAEAIRQIDEEVTIVLVTSMEDRVYDAFGYNIYKFIRKGLSEEERSSILRQCIKYVESTKDTYLFNTEKEVLKLRENEIIYFEIQLRKFYMQTIKGRYRVMVTRFEDILEILKGNSNFAMPNRSTLVNMRYIRTITKEQEVLLEYAGNQEKILMGRNKKRTFYSKFVEYIK
nr:LytTR family DNA-binding domain-containing protein [uncultured Cellulosilyticum sp.]